MRVAGFALRDRDRQQRHLRIQTGDVLPEPVHVEGDAGREVHLVEQQHGGGGDDVGVLGGLVIALGHTEHADLQILAQIEAHRADQVAHVLDEQQVDRIEVQLPHRLADLVGVEAAALAGVDLHDMRGPASESLGVARGGQVADDHPRAANAGESLQRRLQQSRLSAAGPAHQVDRVDAGVAQRPAVQLRDFVVELEHVFDHRDACCHGLTPIDVMRLRVRPARSSRRTRSRD